jgi:cystathionine gamma-lyase
LIVTTVARKSWGPSTLAVHAGRGPDPATGAVMTPIYATSTFVQSAPGVTTGWEYARSGNPTRAEFERALADVEGGSAGFAFASGLAAEATVLDLLAHGSHVITSQDLYGGTWRLFHRVRNHSANLTVTHVDASDPAAFAAALTPRTAMVWVETPGNPLLGIVDLAAVAAFARAHGLLCVVDNTFASPAVQRPLAHGVDIVVHSATKYIGGHSDIIAGAVVVGDNAELAARLGLLQNTVGAVLDPFQSFLARRGLLTLPLRIERHAANALAVARFLDTHARVERVLYPGLQHHPGHALAMRQMANGGGMVAAFLKGDATAVAAFLQRLKLFRLAESLGGVESLVGQPWTMSHGSVAEEHRRAIGITPQLVRLSVGIEDAGDLIADLDAALG